MVNSKKIDQEIHELHQKFNIGDINKEFNDDELALFSTKFEWEKEKEK